MLTWLEHEQLLTHQLEVYVNLSLTFKRATRSGYVARQTDIKQMFQVFRAQAMQLVKTVQVKCAHLFCRLQVEVVDSAVNRLG